MDLFGNRPVPNPSPGFNSYSAGRKHYGAGRGAPNIGLMGGQGLMGYAKRDNEAKARMAAIRRRLGAQQMGNPMNRNVMSIGIPGVK